METACHPMPARRAPRTPRLACQVLAGFVGLAMGAVSLPGSVARGAIPGASARLAATPALGLEALQLQASRQQDEIKRQEDALQAAKKSQQQGEREAAQRAQEIEQLKSQPPGVGHDLRLQDLLAQAQAQAVVLSQQAGELRTREAGLRTARELLVLACDQIIAADDGKLKVAQRLRWLRLRTAQVETLHGATDRAAGDQAVRTVVQAGAALAPGSGAEAAGNDDPQALRERADLLRDSADKLRREMQRLKTRSDEVGRRQRLRERAARVDEDLFAEQTTSRHVVARGSADVAQGTALPVAAPAVGGTGTQSGPSQADSFAGYRAAVDPSTLDILQRVETLSGPGTNMQSLQKAQAELATLTEQLLARATRLEQRADELAHKK